MTVVNVVIGSSVDFGEVEKQVVYAGDASIERFLKEAYWQNVTVEVWTKGTHIQTFERNKEKTDWNVTFDMQTDLVAEINNLKTTLVQKEKLLHTILREPTVDQGVYGSLADKNGVEEE